MPEMSGYEVAVPKRVIDYIIENVRKPGLVIQTYIDGAQRTCMYGWRNIWVWDNGLDTTGPVFLTKERDHRTVPALHLQSTLYALMSHLEDHDMLVHYDTGGCAKVYKLSYLKLPKRDSVSFGDPLSAAIHGLKGLSRKSAADFSDRPGET